MRDVTTLSAAEDGASMEPERPANERGAASEATRAAPPLDSRRQVRALARGQLGAAGPLARKSLEWLIAKVCLRGCARVGRYVRAQGRPIIHAWGEIVIGDRVLLGAIPVRCELAAYRGGRLEVGDRTWINYGVSIAAHASIHIGAGCHLGPYTNILDNAYHAIEDHTREPASRPVWIGDNVWIGGHVIILPGVTIGDGAVIGAGAVVTRDVPARGVAAGNPARLLRVY